MLHIASETAGRRPTILTVPGLHNSGPTHWQTLWEQGDRDCLRAELGMWDDPRRNAWVSKLEQAIHAAQAPVVLVAHSLGCLAVAWWAQLSAQPWGAPVAGALLVAPPDVERADACPQISGFAPVPRVSLPFPSILVASDDDPYCSHQRAFDMARLWGSHFVEAGPCGHINADSGLGWWGEGRELLDRMIGAAEGPVASGAGPAAAEPLLACGSNGGRARDAAANFRIT
jgi:predicted alpha/beta hydrolase family esterase